MRPIDILHVEDDPVQVAWVRTAFAPRKEVAIRQVGTIAAGVTECAIAPDAVLLDLTLPDASDLSGVERLRRAAPMAAIIVFTGTRAMNDGEAAIGAGADDFLHKEEASPLLLRRAVRYAVERRRAEARIRESEARFRAFGDHASFPVFISDPSLEVVHYANPAWEHVLGIPSSEVGRETFRALLAPSDTHRIEEMVAALSAEPKPLVTELRAHVRGEERILHAEAFPIRVDEGTVVGFGGMVHDITERVRTAEHLRELQRVRSQLLNNVVHDIATPLTVVLVHAELMEEEIREARLTERLRIIRRNAEQVTRLLGDLRDIAHLESGNLRLRKSPQDLAPLAKDAVAALAPMATERGIDLDIDVTPPLPVEADDARLRQVVTNLVSNALKFTPVGGRVTVVAQPSGDRARVEVRDTGRGIDPQDARRLFAPFIQLQEDDARKGTGLGLHIAKGLVEAHGGRIAVESEGAGRGSTFWFEVPLRR